MNKIIQSMLRTSRKFEKTIISHRVIHEGQLVLNITVNQDKNEYVIETSGTGHSEIFHCPEEASRYLLNKFDQLGMSS